MKAGLLALTLLALPLPAAALTLAIVRSDQESLGSYETIKRYADFTQAMRGAAKGPLKVIYYRDPFYAARDGQAGDFDLLLAPSQTVASLIKYAFVPVASTADTASAAYVVPPGSAITSLKNAKGARLGVPSYESLTGALIRSDLNEKGIATRSYFASVKYQVMQDATLFGLKTGTYDLAVADKDVAENWVRKNGGRIVGQTATVPVQAFAIGDKVDSADRQRIEDALFRFKQMGLSFKAANAGEFKNIGSMLHTTPTFVPGAKTINAAEAKQLAAQGVAVYDVRVPDEWQAGHLPGAIWDPYQEVSAKEPDFDASVDKFNLSKLPKDKNTPFLMYCQGTVCWKSYKSVVVATRAGWKNVYWLRGGFPEWSAAGYPVVGRRLAATAK